MSRRNLSARDQAKVQQQVQEISESKDLWTNGLKAMITIIWSTQLPTILARKEEVTLISTDGMSNVTSVNGCKERGDLLGCDDPVIAQIADQQLFRYQPREGHVTLVFALKVGQTTAFTFFENISHTSPPPKPDVTVVWFQIEH